MYNKAEIMKLGLERRAETLLDKVSRLSLKINDVSNGLVYTNHLKTIKESVDELLQIQSELDKYKQPDEKLPSNIEFDFKNFGPEPKFNKGDSDDCPF